ncbi:hypothetical protein QLQ15_09405 [Lysobacter sp. LF1]|uniref:Uncharacterized protein n=1 Tax=Lysobacter stagni TaxID=3045172 RepID=A0ABT6XG42_9GAMM|nr:hypothetical protein [Lysobacter sp. LF1]MDI9239125.1 hypothetical protein [Lysobacter sp. LF1]
MSIEPMLLRGSMLFQAFPSVRFRLTGARMQDGDIDYSRYTIDELEEALAGINRDMYPRNYHNLRAAHERLAASRAPASHPDAFSAVHDASEKPGVWEGLRKSRPVTAAIGAVCLWWAYDIVAQAEECPAGRRLIGEIVNVLCERFGREVAASIPFALGLALILRAAYRRRPTAG